MKIKSLVLFITFFLLNNTIFADSFSHEEAIHKRLMPEMQINIKQGSAGDDVPVKKVVAPFSAEKKYNAVCAACHSTGAAGAPKIGDKKAWHVRLEESIDKVYNKAIHGFKGMPPKGTCMTCSDDQIKQIVDYMVSKVK